MDLTLGSMTEGGSVLPRFERSFYGCKSRLTRIGSGPIGGKATGLHRVEREVLSRLTDNDFPGFDVTIPRAVVLTTDVFDAFIRRNGLGRFAIEDHPDDRIAHAFQKADLPAEYVGDLRSLISEVHSPLAVRSSSLLEDALEHPFAGVYGTKMIPNNDIEEDARFRHLIEAVRFVFATTFFAESKSYLQSVGIAPEQEKMAVVIQEVVGQRAGDRFYPCISGVARSHNFYPTGHAKSTDGVIILALGLGKTIVDGGVSWSYAPPYPKAPPPFNDVGDLIKNTQTRFWAIHMGDPPPHDPIRETEHMVQPTLSQAEGDGALPYLVSTYDPGSDRLNSGLDAQGPRVLNFAPLLGSRFIPFNELMIRLLEIGETTLDAPVEIEFAVNLHRKDLIPARLGFLQIRPMLVDTSSLEIQRDELESETALIASERVLGNGRRDDVSDVVYIPPDVFDPGATRAMADELNAINRGLVGLGRPYLLIGFGRWGTSDDRLGVPVAWSQISGAAVIVEATLPDVNPDLSQGSHFFHNLLANRVFYFSVLHDGAHRIDWDWLNAQEVIDQRRFVTHVRSASPLDVRVDGSSGWGVIHRHANPPSGEQRIPVNHEDS
jgi:hypothetical protein